MYTIHGTAKILKRVNQPIAAPVRFSTELAVVLGSLGAPAGFVNAELDEMRTASWAKTANRSVIGSMTDFAFLAEHRRAGHGVTPDLGELSLWLSRTPCSPLDKGHGRPDREVIALSGADNQPDDRAETGGPGR